MGRDIANQPLTLLVLFQPCLCTSTAKDAKRCVQSRMTSPVDSSAVPLHLAAVFCNSHRVPDKQAQTSQAACSAVVSIRLPELSKLSNALSCVIVMSLYDAEIQNSLLWSLTCAVVLQKAKATQAFHKQLKQFKSTALVCDMRYNRYAIVAPANDAAHCTCWHDWFKTCN